MIQRGAGGDHHGRPLGRMRLRADALAWRTIDGEIVALDLRQSVYFAVNPTGAAIWELLAEGATHADLLETLVQEFGADPAEAAADLDAFLSALRAQDLLELEPVAS